MGDGQIFRPTTVDDIAAVINDAIAAGHPLEVRGGGSKAAIGRPDRGTKVLEMTAFGEVIDYDPPELVLTAGAGTPLVHVEALLAAHGQMLAFEPYDHGRLFDQEADVATIGGVIAAGVSGPRRLSAGAVRDHVLGFEAVSGRGERFVAGGKVVKNVTGYDLSKLMAGSWGRLAVLTTVTLKVLPRPRTAATVTIAGLGDREAVAAMAQAMRSKAEVAAAAHLPAAVNGGRALTALRIEGFPPSVRARTEMLSLALRERGPVDVLDAETGTTLWESIRHAAPLRGNGVLWRVNVPPSAGWSVTERLQAHDVRWLYDWAGGLIWVLAAAPGYADVVREAAAAAGGHAMLVRADPELRSTVPILHPEAPGVAALADRVKAAFDPAGILDPHRFG